MHSNVGIAPRTRHRRATHESRVFLRSGARSLGGGMRPLFRLAETGRTSVRAVADADTDFGRTPAEEHRLIMETLSGREPAFAALVKPYLSLFTRGIQRILQDPQETRDTLQEALLRIHSELQGVQAKVKFRAWAYRLCLDEALLKRRANARRRDERSDSPLTAEPSMNPGEGRPIFQESGQLQFLRRPREDVLQLPENQRVVCILRLLEGMDTDSVARKLGLSRERVRELLCQALRQLRAAAMRGEAMA